MRNILSYYKTSLWMACFMFLFATNANAGYVKFGSAIGTNGNKGTELYFGLGLLEYKKFTFGIAADVGVFGPKYSIIGNVNSFRDYIDDPNSPPSDILKYQFMSSGMFTVDYKVFKNYGLYVFGGLGVGYSVKPKKTTELLAYVTKQLSVAKTAEEVNTIVNNPETKAVIDRLVQDQQFLQDVINAAFPNSEYLKSVVADKAKLQSIVNDRAAREEFFNKLDTELDVTGIQVNQGLICGLSNCDVRMAYQAGFGYNWFLYRGLGFDTYVRANGLVGFDPAYSAGANFFIRW